MSKSKKRKCSICKKLKNIDSGMTRLAGIIFYCKECFEKKKKDEKNNKKETCEFC